MEGFATVEEALEELRNGKLILVTDDEDRENEGDFICAAEFATTENINFMAMHGKGLICMPMSAEYVKSCIFRRWWKTIRTIINRVYGFRGLCGNNHRHFRCRAFHDRHALCGRGCKTGGFPASGTYVSASGKEERGVGEKRAYGSNRGSVPPGRLKRMWALL